MSTENQALTISPIITNEDGSYSWTVNGKAYWTTSHGDGLFTSTYSETTNALGQTWMHGEHNKQLEGTGQFSLKGLGACGRRNRVIAHFVKGREDYQSWLYTEGLEHTQTNALTFYRNIKA